LGQRQKIINQPEPFMDSLIRIYQTFDQFEANFIKKNLDDANIFCLVRTNDASGVLPHLSFGMGGIDILVREKDVKESQLILDQINDGT